MLNNVDPIVLRIWYPRIVSDADFQKLCIELKRIRAKRVFIFDNSYMDNFQLASVILAERVAVLKRRIGQLAEQGIIAGINSGATIGHGGIKGFADNWKDRLDIEWWVDANGEEIAGIACPMGKRFLEYVDDYFSSLASTGAREIFIDDDMRLFNHSPVKSEFGCLCENTIERFNIEYNYKYNRKALVVELVKPIKDCPSKIQQSWHSFLKTTFLELAERIADATHKVDPSIRLGLMSVQNFILPFGANYFNEMIKIISGTHKPLLRTHNFHGHPRSVHPGSALFAKKVTPPDTEHLVEIENCGHNFHDYTRSPQQTRYAILTALATGMGGASINILGDQPPMANWERRFFDMFTENESFFRKVAGLTSAGTVMRGVPIKNPSYNLCVDALDYSERNPSATLMDPISCPERTLSSLGMPYEYVESMPALLTGRTPNIMGKARVQETLERGAIVDIDAAKAIVNMGFGEMLNIKIGDPIRSYTGQIFNNHNLCGPYKNQIVPLRRTNLIHKLDYDNSEYEQITSITRAYQNEKIAPGILLRKDNKNRIAVTPYPLLAPLAFGGGESGLLVSYHARYVFTRLFEWVLNALLPVWVDGPPNIAPYYFERLRDDSTIITLFNPDPDKLYNFDLVLGKGKNLKNKVIRSVSADGRLESCANLSVCEEKGEYRLRINCENALNGCDTKIFIFSSE